MPPILAKHRKDIKNDNNSEKILKKCEDQLKITKHLRNVSYSETFFFVYMIKFLLEVW